MTTTNKPMTGAQLDELMAVAMRMQSDSEKMGERSVSMFAYAVQVAVLEIRETRCKYEDLQSQNADLAVQLANAESKCRELAAENMGLKADVPLGAIENGRAFADRLEAYPFECEGGNLNMCSDWQELRRCFEHLSEWAMHSQPETPATDAFLAEVRAQGVDALAQTLEGLVAVSVTRSYIIEFAAQLRKGDKS